MIIDSEIICTDNETKPYLISKLDNCQEQLRILKYDSDVEGVIRSLEEVKQTLHRSYVMFKLMLPSSQNKMILGSEESYHSETRDNTEEGIEGDDCRYDVADILCNMNGTSNKRKRNDDSSTTSILDRESEIVSLEDNNNMEEKNSSKEDFQKHKYVSDDETKQSRKEEGNIVPSTLSRRMDVSSVPFQVTSPVQQESEVTVKQLHEYNHHLAKGDYIQFQLNLNQKLERLVQSMKRTEESRNVLAKHAYQHDDMDSSISSDYNSTTSDQETQEQYPQQSKKKSFQILSPQAKRQCDNKDSCDKAQHISLPPISLIDIAECLGSKQ